MARLAQYFRLLLSGRRAVPFGAGRRGFTLIEMMIALFILCVSILGMTAVTLMSIKTNLANDTRNAAVRLTSDKAEDLLSQSFDSLASGNETDNVNLRSTTVPFNVSWNVTAPTNDLRQIIITVGYQLKGEPKSNRVVLYRHRST